MLIDAIQKGGHIWGANASEDDRQILVEIQDDGSGIPADVKMRPV